MRRSLKGILALATLVAACAIPTEAPNWDVVWNLPLPDSGQTIAVTSFLPTGVTVNGTAPNQFFRATVSSVPPINRTLGVQCPTCPNATAPKPAFTAPVSTTTITLTAGTALTTGTLAAGSQIVLQLVNGFTFDPIKPPGGPTGTVTLTVANGTATLGTLTLLGSTSAIPAGQSTSFTVPLAGTINTAQPLTVSMTMDSPAGAAGSPVAMNSSQLFTVNATPTINISQATVNIAAQTLVPTTQTQDLGDGPLAELESRIDTLGTGPQGSMFFVITNPLSLGANGTLTITGTKMIEDGETEVQVTITPIVKPFVIPAGNGTVRVDFTGKELWSIVGSNLTFSITGNTTAGSTIVTPASAITIFTRLQIRAFIRELE